MIELIYATNNPAKIDFMKKELSDLSVNILSLKEAGITIKSPDEYGQSAVENASIKAKYYYKILKRPLFSCDSELIFKGVAEEDSPGAFVKRVNEGEMSYQDMVPYYASIAKKYGGKITAYYKNAICFYLSDNIVYTYDGELLESEPFYIVDQPHKNYNEGFPIDSLSVDIETSKYYYDIKEKERKPYHFDKIFKSFILEKQ